MASAWTSPFSTDHWASWRGRSQTPALGSSEYTNRCDDQFEFEFALDILLGGFERLHREGWTSRQGRLSPQT